MKAMKEAAKQELFKLVKSMKKDVKDVEGGRCMKGSDARLNSGRKIEGKSGKSTWKEL